MSTVVDKTFAAWCAPLQNTLSSSGDGGIRFPGAFDGNWSWHMFERLAAEVRHLHTGSLVCENMLSTVLVNIVIGLGKSETSETRLLRNNRSKAYSHLDEVSILQQNMLFLLNRFIFLGKLWQVALAKEYLRVELNSQFISWLRI